MRKMVFVLGLVIAASVAGAAWAAEDGVLVQSPELVVFQNGQSEMVALPGTAYRDFAVTEDQASFTLDGFALPSGVKRLHGQAIKQVSWTPQADGATAVVIQFKAAPLSSLINAVEGTQDRPTTPQVLAGFTFPLDTEEKDRSFPTLGSYGKRDVSSQKDEHGTYTLPELAPVKYSDALVTLQVNGVDFRDVLWFLSEVGHVSIMLDPYWADEPTGNRRPVGAGADPTPGSGGGGEPGFRGAGGFVPGMIREGTGNLSLNFENVPFDRALELVVMAAGLVMVEIQPSS